MGPLLRMGEVETGGSLLERMENEYVSMVREHMEESATQTLEHMGALEMAQRIADGRVHKEHKYHRKRENQMRKELEIALRDKRRALDEVESMQEELAAVLAELHLAAERIDSLELRAQFARTRAESGISEVENEGEVSAILAMERLRHKVERLETSLSEAKRDARSSQEALGREMKAAEISSQQLELSRSRLLQAQTALSASLEEKTKLTRQLEEERVISANQRRRAEEAEAEVEKVRKCLTDELEQLRSQSNAFAESSTESRASLRRTSRKSGAAILSHAIDRFRLKRVSSGFLRLAAVAAHTKAESPLLEELAKLREKGLSAADEVREMAQKMEESEAKCAELMVKLDAAKETAAEAKEDLERFRRSMKMQKREFDTLMNASGKRQRQVADLSEREGRKEEASLSAVESELQESNRRVAALEGELQVAEERARDATSRLSKLRAKTLALYLAAAARKVENRAMAEAYDKFWAAAVAGRDRERRLARDRADHVSAQENSIRASLSPPPRISREKNRSQSSPIPLSQPGSHGDETRSRFALHQTLDQSVLSPHGQSHAWWHEEIANLAASGDSTVLPRLMQSLRVAIAEEIYSILEQLYRTVGADMGEIHGSGAGGPAKQPLGEVEQLQFSCLLRDASAGRLRWLALIFLRTYESIKALLSERKTIARGGSKGKKHGSRRGTHAKRASKVKCNSDAPAASLASLKMGRGASPGDKARSVQALRNRLISLIEDTMDVWMQKRRSLLPRASGSASARIDRTGGRRPQWHTCRGGKSMDFLGCELCANLTGAESALGAIQYESRRRATAFAAGALDSGAGPRLLWNTLRGSGLSFTDTAWSVRCPQIEEDMWNIALLVRCGGPGVNLSRSHTQRKQADRRMVELILLHLRTTLVTKGIEYDPPESLQQGATLSSSLFCGLQALNQAAEEGAPADDSWLDEGEKSPQLAMRSVD